MFYIVFIVFVIIGYSGIGKIMLLEKLIFKLIVCNFKVGLIKYLYYNIDVDKLGKDSYWLCLVGVNFIVIVCDECWVLMVEIFE